MVLAIVRIIPFLFNIDQIGISRGHICFPSVPPFPQKYQQNESLPEAIMVGRDRDRFFCCFFSKQSGQPNWIDTYLQKLSKKCRLNALWVFQNTKSWCCFTELRVLLSGGLCLRQPRNQHAQQVSVKSETFGRCLNVGCSSVFLNSSGFSKFHNFPEQQTFQSLVRLFVS